MSTFEERSNTGNQSINRYDTSKIFVGHNRYETATYTNDTGEEITLAAGTLMGRKHADGEIIPLESDASDGSQFPVGILNQAVTVADGDSVDVSICVSGDVVESKVVFVNEYDDMDAVVSSRRLRDRIAADTVGIKLVGGDELTDYDNE
jgi:hypothetical protein